MNVRNSLIQTLGPAALPSSWDQRALLRRSTAKKAGDLPRFANEFKAKAEQNKSCAEKKLRAAERKNTTEAQSKEEINPGAPSGPRRSVGGDLPGGALQFAAAHLRRDAEVARTAVEESVRRWSFSALEAMARGGSTPTPATSGSPGSRSTSSRRTTARCLASAVLGPTTSSRRR